eukprot:m51a1_g6414 hypothetical protein (474) ;mRNA; r:274863-279492
MSVPTTAHESHNVLIDTDKCVRCNQCVRECPVCVISPGIDGSTPISTAPDCLKCLHCVVCLKPPLLPSSTDGHPSVQCVCPTGALGFKGVDCECVLPVLRKEQRATPKQVAALIRERRSTRAFSKTPIPRDAIKMLLRRASPAPSRHNRREVKWLVVESPAVIEDLKRLILQWWRISVAKSDPQTALAIMGFIKAPYVPGGGRGTDINIAIALETAELVASAMGFGTLWNGVVFDTYENYEPLQQSVCPTGALSFKSVDPERVLPVLKKEQRATPEQVAALIRERRSTRKFSKTPLAHDVIMTLLRRVAPAPSGHNVRAVRWVVVETPSVIEDIKSHTIEALRKCATDGDPRKADLYTTCIKAYEAGQNILTRDAPHILVAYVAEGGRVEDIDVSIALETAELVASSMGLGTCWGGLLFDAYMSSEPLQAFYEKIGVPRGSKMQVDASEWMRNGDYVPNRMQAQDEAINILAS